MAGATSPDIHDAINAVYFATLLVGILAVTGHDIRSAIRTSAALVVTYLVTSFVPLSTVLTDNTCLVIATFIVCTSTLDAQHAPRPSSFLWKVLAWLGSALAVGLAIVFPKVVRLLAVISVVLLKSFLYAVATIGVWIAAAVSPQSQTPRPARIVRIVLCTDEELSRSLRSSCLTRAVHRPVPVQPAVGSSSLAIWVLRIVSGGLHLLCDLASTCATLLHCRLNALVEYVTRSAAFVLVATRSVATNLVLAMSLVAAKYVIAGFARVKCALAIAIAPVVQAYEFIPHCINTMRDVPRRLHSTIDSIVLTVMLNVWVIFVSTAFSASRHDVQSRSRAAKKKNRRTSPVVVPSVVPVYRRFRPTTHWIKTMLGVPRSLFALDHFRIIAAPHVMIEVCLSTD
ncbi:hypothetical protein DAEQUDRAFT_761918 [Daedalea quercina L-15889]|uniref:Uncharacterized protein n=1 Tax=Daedalea quercina L-15889 TaxID=1314783 RepID=A0A165TUS2_9APHY|nr:hypothetical protein DAEQUDRAFT_761918 [Daedalea quercina L-15889]